MNKCEKCGFLHYRTDPCRKPKDAGQAQKVERRSPKPEASGSIPETCANTPPKPKRSGNRHRPGYFTDYMRQYRAKLKARDNPDRRTE